jgi:hypothetical protein
MRLVEWNQKETNFEINKKILDVEKIGIVVQSDRNDYTVRALANQTKEFQHR